MIRELASRWRGELGNQTTWEFAIDEVATVKNLKGEGGRGVGVNKHQLLSLYDSVAAERVLSLDAVDGSPLFSVLINCQQILHFPHNNQLNLEPTLSLPRMHEERERERERERSSQNLQRQITELSKSWISGNGERCGVWDCWKNLTQFFQSCCRTSFQAPSPQAS